MTQIRRGPRGDEAACLLDLHARPTFSACEPLSGSRCPTTSRQVRSQLLFRLGFTASHAPPHGGVPTGDPLPKKFNSRPVILTLDSDSSSPTYGGGLFFVWHQWFALDLQQRRSGPTSRPSSAQPRGECLQRVPQQQVAEFKSSRHRRSNRLMPMNGGLALAYARQRASVSDRGRLRHHSSRPNDGLQESSKICYNSFYDNKLSSSNPVAIFGIHALPSGNRSWFGRSTDDSTSMAVTAFPTCLPRPSQTARRAMPR
jgi:hypothetical protein